MESWLYSYSYVTFLGVLFSQSWVDLLVWERFLSTYNHLKAIIEFGTYAGGFSAYLLLQTVQRGMKFWTFDVDEFPAEPLLDFIGLADHFHQGDLFAPDTIALVRSILETDVHPLLLYCDNGHKVNEIDFYLPYLWKGDLLGVHDYGIEIGTNHIPRMYGDKLEPIFWDECEALGSITRFWRVTR